LRLLLKIILKERFMSVFYRRMPSIQYLMPETLEDALEMLSTFKEDAKILAGGTDLIPGLKRREISVPRYVIDIKSIEGLDELSYDKKSGLKIGPLVTIDRIAQSPVVSEHFPCLSQAARSMASPQVRNRGTIAGNICNAVPSADSAPSLIVLSARVMIRSITGERSVPVEKFFSGPKKTVLDQDELLTEITIPNPAPGSLSAYLKLSPRHSMDLAIVGAAAAGLCKNGTCREIKIALGAVAPTPLRAPMAENILLNKKITTELIEEASQNALMQCSPIDDHRASREYRCDMVNMMTKRTLIQVLMQ
jgi:CO/xanthine dehydrogenase FAD-binding subunit